MSGCRLFRGYFIGGSAVLPCRIVENGKTIVEKRENGEVVSKSVNGQKVAIENHPEKKPGLTM